MPTVSDVSGTGLRSYEEYQESIRTPNKELGKTEFLQLLAAQLQYQDPLEPVKDSDFVAQLAQFSSLQQMESLNTTMTNMQFYNYAGKLVYAQVKIDGKDYDVTGVVDRVFMSDGVAWVQVDDYVFKASLIQEVLDKDLVSQDNPLVNSAHMIGREVKANYLDDDNKAAVFTGVVTRIHIKSGQMVADVKNSDGEIKTVAVANIVDIAAEGAPETPTGTEGSKE